MIIRDFQVDNPEAKDFKKWIMADGLYDKFNKEQQTRQFYPFIMKFSQVGTLEDDNYQKMLTVHINLQLWVSMAWFTHGEV